MHSPKETWAAELAAYEKEKRHNTIDATTLRLTSSCPTLGSVQFQDRVFDPLLQRFREPQVESRRRGLEDQERVAHLNRAQDIQVMREQPFNILTHESKLEVLAPGEDPTRLGATGRRAGKARHGKAFSDSVPEKDFHILSNLPVTEHHWRPADRSPPKEEAVAPRKLHAHLVKDFNIVTNGYTEHNEERERQARHLNLLEGTKKYMKQNRFDPLTQQFNDPRHEEMVRAADQAREVEIVMRKRAQLPPSYWGRQTEHYGIVSHTVHNDDVMKMWDSLEGERKERYKNRYIVEHNVHVRELKGTHVTNSRQLNRIAPERFEETRRRGYDIIDNTSFGQGAKDKQLHKPFTRDRKTPWERATERTAPSGWGIGGAMSTGGFAAGRSMAPPPAPAIPGAAVGSVFAQPKGM